MGPLPCIDSWTKNWQWANQAFGTDLFVTYDPFETWCPCPDETVDIFLVQLKKLAILIAPLPGQFVSGCSTSYWPDPVLSWLTKRRTTSQLLQPFNQLKWKMVQTQPSVAMVMSLVIGARAINCCYQHKEMCGSSPWKPCPNLQCFQCHKLAHIVIEFIVGTQFF